MFIIRPITLKDQHAVENLAMAASAGLTNLPKDRKLLHKKILNSLDTFNQKTQDPYKRLYLFVLEDSQNKTIGGTCGIKAKTGKTIQDYFYRLETIQNLSHGLPIPKEMTLLNPVTYVEGPSEIYGLFPKRECRQGGLGKLLSLSRFLFIASNPSAFDDTIIAEMRGVIDEKERSPFWDSLGRKFLDLPLHKVLDMMSQDIDFIPEILPKYPVYTSFLTKAAQRVLGKTHRNTKPALKMLVKEGFHLTNEVDIFVGAPKIAAETRKIQTIQDSQTAMVEKIDSKEKDTEDFLISNDRFNLDFRACYGSVKQNKKNLVTISSDVAKALHIKKGNRIRFVKKNKM